MRTIECDIQVRTRSTAAGKDLHATASPNTVKPPKKRKTKGNSNGAGTTVDIRESKMTTVLDQNAEQNTASTASRPGSPEKAATTSSEVVNADIPMISEYNVGTKPIESGSDYRDNQLREKQEANRKKRASKEIAKKVKPVKHADDENRQRPMEKFLVRKNI